MSFSSDKFVIGPSITITSRSTSLASLHIDQNTLRNKIMDPLEEEWELNHDNPVHIGIGSSQNIHSPDHIHNCIPNIHSPDHIHNCIPNNLISANDLLQNHTALESRHSLFNDSRHSLFNDPLALPYCNQKISPIPTLQMLMICLVTFVEPVQFGMLFPFAYFMVKDFKVSDNDQDLGFWVGVLASSFCVAQLVTSLPWGYVSDRYGRRPVILFGLLGNALTCCLFGFSKSFTYAITLRSLNGFLNGNVGVVKSMLGEMTDDTNRGRAFSYWESAYGLGTIVGPMLGGILVNPVTNYPWLFSNDSIFKTYPYLLPCLVSSLISVVGSMVGFCLLEESAPALVKKKKAADRMKKRISNSESTLDLEEETPLLSSHLSVNHDDVNSNDSPPLSFKEALTPKVLSAIGAYASWCLVTIMYEEVYALYIAEPLAKGGLAFTSLEIGTILSLSGIIQVVSQLIAFPLFEKRFGLLGTFRIASLLLSLFSFLLPFTTDFAFFLGAGQSLPFSYTPSQKTSVSVLLLLLLAGKTVATVIGYIPVIIFVNDSAPNPQSLGTVHGTGQVFASLVRSIGPTLGGFLWSWSLQPSHSAPFDFHFTFFFTSGLCLGCWYASFSIEKFVKK